MVKDRIDLKIELDQSGSDRAEAFRSGPRSSCFLFSVFGPVRVWTGWTSSWTEPKSLGVFFVFSISSSRLHVSTSSSLLCLAVLSLSTSALSESPLLLALALAFDSSVLSSPCPICSLLSFPLLSTAALLSLQSAASPFRLRLRSSSSASWSFFGNQISVFCLPLLDLLYT